MAISHLYPTQRPALDLNFARQKRLDSRVTFTRGSTATYVGSDGLIKTAASDEARFDHDPVTGESLGLLVEESRTNLVTYSEDLTDGSWVKGSSTVAGNAISAPDGTVTADKLVETANGPTSHVVSKATTTTAGSHTFSVYLKKAERSFALLYDLTNSVGAYFNLDTGAITTGGSGIPAASAYSSQYAGNGWWRCSITQSASAGTTTYRVYLAESGTVYSYTGNGTSGIYVWGAQLEESPYPTSYIPTSGSTVTRSAEIASMTGTNFSSWYNQSEGTFLSQLARLGSPTTGSIGAIIGGSNPNVTSSSRHMLIGNGNAQISSSGGASYGFGLSAVGFHRLVNAYKLNDFNAAYDGNLLTADTSYTPPTCTQLVFAGVFPIANNTGRISRLTYYPTRLSDTQLQALTL